jgi:hypothetical protein
MLTLTAIGESWPRFSETVLSVEIPVSRDSEQASGKSPATAKNGTRLAFMQK